MLPAYAHFATLAAPATVQLYTAPVLVFKYLSLTRAAAIPELLNTAAVVEVPVIAVP